METSIVQYAILCVTGLSYGFSKTGVMGVSAAIVPLMLCFFTPGQSLGIALPILIFADFITLYMLRKSVIWRHVFRAIPWGLAGVFAGWRFLSYAQSLPDGAGDAFLRRSIAAVMVLVVISGAALRFARRGREEAASAGSESGAERVGPLRYILGSMVSVFGGFTTMIANNGGPSWVVYMMLFRLGKYHFLGTVAWVIFVLNAAKLPFGIQLGYVNADTLSLNLLMIPFVLLGLFSGRWVLERISQSFFENLVQALALMGSLYLLIRTSL